MSVLGYPRIHFQGRCLINPPTADNDADVDQIDAVNVEVLPELDDIPDAKARSLLMATYTAISPINQKPHTYLKGGWDYFGDSSVWFLGVEVTSVVGDDGVLNTSDPIVGREVQLIGKKATRPVICDVDPTGIAASQIFVGGLELGNAEIGLTATDDTCAYCRWLVWRNAKTYQGEENFIGAGATWQFSMPGDGLTFRGTGVSPVLLELAAASKAPKGIQVQFCVYLTKPLISDTALGTLFQSGSEPSNPAEAFIVGTIGVWDDEELRTVPDGRMLMAQADRQGLDYFFGMATARVHSDRNRVTLNLISAIPEANYDRPPTTKVELGKVQLGVIPPGAIAPILIDQPVAYNNDSYLKSGGIVDVSYDPAKVTATQLDEGTLVLVSEKYPKPILTEENSTQVVVSDDGALYYEEQGLNNEAAKQDVFVLVRERGRPPRQDVEISLWEYQFALIPGGNQTRASSALTLVEPGSLLCHRITFPPTFRFPAGCDKPIPIPIRAIDTGPLTLVFTLDGRRPGPFFPGWDTSFTGVRVLPDDDYSDMTDDELTWDFMYKTVFKYYYLIFPAMSKIIPFNNQARMEAAARALVARIDPDLWDTTLYMPTTRDLSKGKRELIERWADNLARGQPVGPGASRASSPRKK